MHETKNINSLIEETRSVLISKIILILVPIVMSGYSIESQILHEDSYRSLATRNAFYIVERSLKGKTSDKEVVDTVISWIDNNRAVELGSLKSICKTTPHKLDYIMNKTAHHRVCILVR
ncbi:hypothetical protein [Vibrio sp. AND4]|uniref:hypothetical protein n=1 Tax=Vibrio sp. AND4 TaxID=314289 RepID=UPI00015F2BE8|nr:hypothetical protein [Vibrio sp. AND4]EDP57963.1 hypothetical protein AND4_05314 [Vibrio sp. AND4]